MVLCDAWSKGMFWLWLLLVLIAYCLCAWLAPKSELANSAARAFDSSALMLGRGAGDDDDEVRMPERARRGSSSHVPGSRRSPPRTSEPYRNKRKRVTPFVAKKVAASYSWRCAACGELLTEDYEVDHHIPLQNFGSNDISNLRPLHKRCHLLKSSLEQRRS